jgi:hypothetical protein
MIVGRDWLMFVELFSNLDAAFVEVVEWTN